MGYYQMIGAGGPTTNAKQKDYLLIESNGCAQKIVIRWVIIY